MNSRVDERVRKFSPRWELSLKADSCCIWAVGGGGGARGRSGGVVPAEEEVPARPRGGKSKVLAGAAGH